MDIMDQKKFYCEKCKSSLKTKAHYERHLQTKKHKGDGGPRAARIRAGGGGGSPVFCCVPCGFGTNNKRHFELHCLTNKHIKRVVEPNRRKKEEEKGKIKEMTVADRLKFLEEKIAAQNVKIEKLESGEAFVGIARSNVKNIMTNCHNTNNKVSINVFLNENCGNAMNIEDFVDKIELALEDINFANMNGCPAGISQVVLKNLSKLDPTERPLHCSDQKRLKFYVKDKEKGWHKDKWNKGMKKMCDQIQHKQVDFVHEWSNKEENKNFKKENGIKSDFWLKASQAVFDYKGGSKSELERIKKKIKRQIAPHVLLRKVMEESVGHGTGLGRKLLETQYPCKKGVKIDPGLRDHVLSLGEKK